MRNNIKISFLLITITVLISNCVQGNKSNQTQESIQPVDTLLDEKEVNFFNEFPNSFGEFQKLYGFDDNKGESIYYRSANRRIDSLFSSKKAVSDSVFVNKLIDISKDGKWDADAVNYFQQNLRTYFFVNSQVFLSMLGKEKQSNIDGFWYFFLDEPHLNEDVDKEARKLISSDPTMVKSYSIALEKVKADNVH
jgi:hypothetical protein